MQTRSLGAVVAGIVIALGACAKSAQTPGYVPDDDAGADADVPEVTAAEASPSLGDACDGLKCQQVSCPNGGTTRIEGDVYDPGGKTKLYNVVVFVPNADLQPIPSGATGCDTCAGLVTGNPLVATLTDEAGHFKLDNVPQGTNVPLVVQVGKWRRAFKIPRVDACATTTVQDGVLRLPKNQSEGNIPQMAVVMGGYDRLGCLFSRIGVEASEFTAPTGQGRIHVYRSANNGGNVVGGGALDATALWNDQATLAKYDAVFPECEGSTLDATDPTAGTNKTNASMEAMRAYVNAGGRLFAEHAQLAWLRDSPEADFASVATWARPDAGGIYSTYLSEVLVPDTTFPKGQSFAKWLTNVGAAPDGGLAVGSAARNVAGLGAAQRWLYEPQSNETRAFVFNTPLDKPQDQRCGRVVFSDYEAHHELGTYTIPTDCENSPLTPEELALEFLLFDLTSCIQPDSEPPKPPIK